MGLAIILLFVEFFLRADKSQTHAPTYAADWRDYRYHVCCLAVHIQ